MDILKRDLAPISDAAWAEVDAAAREILTMQLTARRFVDVSAAEDWSRTAVSSGRLHVPKGQAAKVRYGVHAVRPLVEARVSFPLSIWELDNVARGAKDINLDPLEEAARAIAEFEEKAVYHGFAKGEIEGLLPSAEKKPILFAAENPSAFLDTLNQAAVLLQESAIAGPYRLVINPGVWRGFVKETKGYPMHRHIEQVVDGPPIQSRAIEGAILVSARGGDFELTLGQDLSIGYESHDKETVALFLAESFTFRVIEPRALVPLRTRSR